MSQRLALPAAAALLLGTPAAAPAQPFAGQEARLIAIDLNGYGDGSASDDGRLIAATSTRKQGQAAIWLFDRASAAWRQLTATGNNDREPAISPDGQFVAYVTDRSGQTDIRVVEVATGRDFALTNDPVEEEYPAWSHDGHMVVFTGGPWKERNFFTVEFSSPAATLSAPRAALDQTGHVGACRFKHDGKLICHVYEGKAGELLEIDPATRRFTKLTEGGWWFYKPDASPTGWIATTVVGDDGDVIRFLPAGGRGDPLPSPALPGRWPHFVRDGAELIYHRRISAGTGLSLVDLATGKARDLGVTGELSGFAALAPDASLVAYCVNQDGRWSVRLRDPATGADRGLAIAEEACNPAWSPDGGRLAIALRRGEHWAQAVVDSDGGNLKVLKTGTGTDWQLNAPAAWSPDGTRLAFAGTTAPYESDLFVADLQSGEVRSLTNDAWYDEGPSWSADGRDIVFMSTRGGSWTWGLFAMPAEGGAVRVLLEPDAVERRFPQLDQAGTLWWIESDLCLGATYLVRRPARGAPHKFLAIPGASWASRSADGRAAVVPVVRQRIEYWSIAAPGARLHGR